MFGKSGIMHSQRKINPLPNIKAKNQMNIKNDQIIRIKKRFENLTTGQIMMANMLTVKNGKKEVLFLNTGKAIYMMPAENIEVIEYVK